MKDQSIIYGHVDTKDSKSFSINGYQYYTSKNGKHMRQKGTETPVIVSNDEYYKAWKEFDFLFNS